MGKTFREYMDPAFEALEETSRRKFVTFETVHGWDVGLLAIHGLVCKRAPSRAAVGEILQVAAVGAEQARRKGLQGMAWAEPLAAWCRALLAPGRPFGAEFRHHFGGRRTPVCAAGEMFSTVRQGIEYHMPTAERYRLQQAYHPSLCRMGDDGSHANRDCLCNKPAGHGGRHRARRDGRTFYWPNPGVPRGG